MIGIQYGASKFSPAPPSISSYLRPADWLPLPAVSVGEQKLVALVAVFPHDSNHLSLVCSGNYTVNWGDGVTQDFAADVQADRNYSYNSIPANDTSRGYRQAILQITPQAGHNLTTISFNRRHPAASQVLYTHKLLDLRVAGGQISSLIFSLTTCNAGMLEQFEFVGPNSILDFTHFGYNSYSLRSILQLDTSKGLDFTNFLLNCFSLLALPAIDTSKGLNFTNFLLNNRALVTLPAIDTSKGTNFTNAFNGCASLQAAHLNTSQGLNFTNFLSGANSLGSLILQGQKENINVANQSLGKQALINLFNGLATVTGKTITISGNYGAASLTQADRNIAINKGWTLVG